MPQSFNFKQLQNSLPKRPKDSHKGNFGKVFICAGSAGMGGAGILASETSLFCGSGLVKLTTDKSNVKAALSRNPEVMTAGINMGNDINVQIDIKDQDVILYGPGIYKTMATDAIFNEILKNSNNCKLIFDAGALHIMASVPHITKKLDQSILMTPHPGEAAILLKKSINEIQKNRTLAAENISKTYKASIVILKGMGTVIYSAKDNESYICMDGGPELATGGTGDILAGLLSALLAQGLDEKNASLIAVAVHAEAGRIFSKEIGEIGLNASSLIPIIRKLLNQ